MGIFNRADKSVKNVICSLQGAAPATAANYGKFFVADRRYKVIKVQSTHRTASSSGTVMVERLQGTEAKDAGDDLLSSAISTAGTAETLLTGTLVTTGVTVLEVGDALGLVSGGTLTSSADLCISVQLQPLS